MTDRFGRLLAAAILVTGLTAGLAAAQTPAQLNVAGRGTDLGGSIAVATSSSDTGPMVAGSVGWRITRWITAEARGGWLASGPGVDGISADVGALVNVVARRRTTPYVGLAFGLYSATIDDSGASHVPNFYGMRMQEATSGAITSQTFTDPAWRLTAGVDVIRHRNISIRPEASVVLVQRAGATETITTFGIRLGYVFEDHPVTPSSR
jgi:hypothetical protein